MRFRLSTQDVAFMAILAAFSVIVIRILPGIPIVGVPSANIKFDVAVAPIYGLIIGPYLGFLAALIGGLITAGDPFSILTSFAPAISALVAGLLARENVGNNKSNIRGWMLALVVLGCLILGWYLTGVGQRAPLYPVLHVAGFVLILLTRGWTAKAFKEGKTEGKNWRVKPYALLGGILLMVVAYMFTRPYSSDLWIVPYMSLPMFFAGGITIFYSLFGSGKGSFVSSVSLACYCGIIADHMVGNIIFIGAVNVLIPFSVIEQYFLEPLGLPDVASLFMYMIPVSALERMLFTVVAVIIGVGLILALKRANLLTHRL